MASACPKPAISLDRGRLGRRFPSCYVLFVLSKLYPLDAPYTEHYFTWLQSGFLNVGFDFVVDRLTAVMLLVVTGVGLLIHIYAIGYMEHEGGYYRFFSYLNLFMFFMLILVLASNLLLMFVGWEGVGLCSYLLVGFYFTEKFATDAANKAFIVNRIGDFGFLLGIFLTVYRVSRRSISASSLPPSRPCRSKRQSARSPRLLCCYLSAQPENPRSFRFMSGCPMPWPVPRRSPR